MATWELYMRNIAGLVRPGGLFITAALRASTGYVVGGKTFPSAAVDEDDLRRVLDPRLGWDDGVVEVCDLSAHRSHGYTSIILARARKTTATGGVPSSGPTALGGHSPRQPQGPAAQMASGVSSAQQPTASRRR